MEFSKTNCYCTNSCFTPMSPIEMTSIIQTQDTKTVRQYPGDLTTQEKLGIESFFVDDNTLQIAFKQSPHLEVTVRKQDIFKSGANVIVNAANAHLGGGGGIDGAIHAKGGVEYAKGHRELQKEYQGEYVLGHAAMIGSGALKETYQIDNVIVVAGPQGDSNFEKENQLYSCCYNSLELAQSQDRSSIALPSISTGIFGFPRDRAASIMLRAVSDFTNHYPNAAIKRISVHFLPTEPKSFLEEYQKAAS